MLRPIKRKCIQDLQCKIYIFNNEYIISCFLFRASSPYTQNMEKRVSDKPPIVPRNYFNQQPQFKDLFKDSSLTGSFTQPSASSSKSHANHSHNNSLQNQFLIKSSTPVLNERCLSPINRLDLATSKEQLEHLEEFCKRDYSNANDEMKPNQFGYLNSHPFNYAQFANQSPNSTCSTPNRSAKSSSSTSQNNSLPKSGNYLDKLFNNNFYNFKPSMVSKSNSNDNLSLSDRNSNSLLCFNRLNDSSNFSSGSNFHSNFSSNFSSKDLHTNHQHPHFLQPSQTNSFTSLSLSSNSSSVFGGSIRDIIVRSRPVSFSFSSNNSPKENRNTITGRNPFFWFRRTSRSSSAPELGLLFSLFACLRLCV